MNGLIVGIAVILGLVGLLTGGIFGGGFGARFHVEAVDCSSVSVRYVGGGVDDEQQLCFSGVAASSSGQTRDLFVAGNAEWAVAVIRDTWPDPVRISSDLERFLDLALDYTPNVAKAGAFSEPFRFEAYDIMTFTAELRAEEEETVTTGCFGFSRRPDANPAEAGSRHHLYGLYCRAGTDEITNSGIGSVLRRVKSGAA